MEGIRRRPRGAWIGCAVVGVVGFALPAGNASATEVSLGGSQAPFHALRVKETGNELNRVKVRVLQQGRAYIVRDDAARVEAGRGCVAKAPDRARRRLEDTIDNPDGLPGLLALVRIVVKTGELNDRVVLDGRSSYRRGAQLFGFVSTGPGADWIVGGRLASLSDGGAGDDLVDGGPGFDEFAAGPGFDGNDEFVSEGFALVNYSRRTEPMTVDLPGDLASAPGETDELKGVKGAFTGNAADVLIGGTAGNVLFANGGPDVVEGGAGADWIDGGRGFDSFAGERGSDTIFSEDDRDETVDCGAGKDFVAPDTTDELVSCEEFADVIILPQRSFAGRVNRAVARMPAEPPSAWVRHPSVRAFLSD
jgi:RTX calcium-binding nonapeptide repeat (4 copies)